VATSTISRLPQLPKLRVEAPTVEINLIDQLLAEQKQLQTPIARYSELHDTRPDLAEHYRSLIPLTKPGADEQYAFEVSLDRCTGCKACVSACHSMNGLDEEEAWRDTGTVIAKNEPSAWQQTITSACHHCADPGCLSGCPVGAYLKEPETGIVHHLDDQCIGCSYCILKCPYEVPKYSKKRGIVRKCDMCRHRLAEGEAPACVQACPTEAIRIVKVPRQPSDHEPDPILSSNAVASDKITQPMTRYVGRSVPSDLTPADHEQLLPEHTHWPLALMLTLTQAGIGLLTNQLTAHPSQALTITGAVLFNLGMIAATLHLGHPLKAWRFFIGLRRSWLSREILAFSLFGPLPLLLAALPFLPEFTWKSMLTTVARGSLLPMGLLAVFTSVMIYVDTHRVLWKMKSTATRFFGTVLLFGGLACLPPWALSALILLKICAESRLLHGDELRRERAVTQGPLRIVGRIRLGCAILAAVLAPVSVPAAITLLLVSELSERVMFFRAVRPLKMPGSFGPLYRH
jgi:formate dehydrogenase iron-sulfur subunit